MLDSLFGILAWDIAASRLMFLWVAIVVKSLTIAFYLNLIYLGICAFKRLFRGRIGARTGYYCWYTLFLALPLSGLDFNAAVKLPIYELGALHFDETGWMICCALALLWLLIILYRVESQIIKIIKLEGAIAAMKPLGVGEIKERAAAVFGLNARRIGLVAASWVNSPLSYGVFKKTILLPEDYNNRYSEDELYLLLLHEMAHIKNRDTVKLHFVSFARCLFPFPASLLKNIARDREILCDSMVLAASNVGSDMYGELLVKEISKGSPIAGPAFSNAYTDFESRVDAIYDLKPEKRRFPVYAGIVFMVLVAAFVYAWIVPAGWYRVTHPTQLQYDVLVTFEGEDYYAIKDEFHSAFNNGNIPVNLPGRPDRAYFGGVCQFKEDGNLYIDQLALRDALDGLSQNGAKPEFVEFVVPRYHLTTENPANVGVDIPVSALESIDESDRYEVVDTTDPLDEHLYSFLAHWL